MIRLGCTLCFLFVTLLAQGQLFRSRQTGDWNQSSTWEEFIAGSWQPTTNTPSFTSSFVSVESPHTVTVTANVTIDQTIFQAGSTVIVNDGITLTLNQGLATDLTSSGTLQMLGESIIGGGGDIVVNGTFRSGSQSTSGAIQMGNTGGNLRVNNRVFNSTSYIIYDGTGPQFIASGQPNTTGIITEIINPSGITFDPSVNGNPGGGMVFPDALILTSGDLHISATPGNGRTLILRGTLTANGNHITMSGPCSLRIEGSGVFGTFPFPAGNQSMFNFTMIRPGETITFNNPVAFTGDFTSTAGSVVVNGASSVFGNTTLNGGSVDFNGATTLTGSASITAGSTLFFEGQTLTTSNSVSASGGGVLSSDGSSTLVLSGSTAHTGSLAFAGGSSLNTLTLNMTNAGTSATIGSPVTVTTALNLTDGILDNPSSNLTVSLGGAVTKNSSGSIATASPSGGPWNLTYVNVSQSTGFEIPASGNLTTLTVSTGGGSIVTLTQSINVSGAFNITANNRIFTCGANDVSVGSLANTGTFNAPTAGAPTGLTVLGGFVNNSVFNHNNGVVRIAAATAPSGININTTNFFTISIAAAGTLTSPTTLNIVGNFINAGSFLSNSGTVVFRGGTNTLSGATMPTTSFNNVTVNAGATLVPASNFILTGNLVVNGGYTAGTGTITFAGTSTLSGTNISTTQFNNVTINPASTLTAPLILLVGGNFTNDGTFTAGATTTITFTGATSTISGATILATNFNNITINPGASVTPPTTLNLNGNFTNNGSFVAGAGTVSFGGSSGAKTLSGTTNTQFSTLILNKSNGGTSLTVTSPQTVTSALTLSRGILNTGPGNLTLSSGSTLTRVNLGSLSATPAGGPWNLVYLGSTMATSIEIPASGILTSLTVSVDIAKIINLTQAITVQNALTISAVTRTLACGTNNVTAGSIVNNGTISAPGSAATTGITVSGNFTNNGTFTHNNGQVTFSGNTTLSGTSTTNFSKVTITGTLTGSNFGVASNFTNNGTFTAPSLVTFNGVALQTISGSTPTTTFRGMRVTNPFSPTGVSVQSNVDLVDSLSLASNVKFDADGPAGTAIFTLLSTSDAPAVDAKISRLPAGAVVQGSVTVQRFFRPKDNFDRFISSPVSGATVAMLQASTPATSFPVTGGFAGTSFPCTGCNNNGHNFRYYKEADPGIISKGYIAFITSTSTTLVPGVGYDAFMWNGVFNTTVSLRGPINTGTIALGVVTGPPANSITHTNNGDASADGWNLVGNPFPSPIQWNNGAGWSRTNIDPTVWVWDVVGRVWHSYNANTSTGDLTNGVIASGQGFWVIASAVGAASLSVNEQAKSYGISGTGSYFRTASAGEEREPVSKALRISLTKGESTDNSFILIDPRASLRIDEGFDALKLQLGIESISISMISEGRNWGHMALGNELPEAIPLSLYADEAGTAKISFEIPDSYPALAGYYLVDKYLSRSVLVGSGKPYAFEIIAGDPASQGERFYLSKYPLVEKLNILSAVRLIAHPNPAVNMLHIELNTEQVTEMVLLDYAGRPVSRINPVVADGMTKADVDVSAQPTGFYILKVMSEGNLMTRKIVISH